MRKIFLSFPQSVSGSRRGNEADFLSSARNRPPRYLGGYHFSDTLCLYPAGSGGTICHCRTMLSPAIASSPAASLPWPPARAGSSVAFRMCACAAACLLLAWALPSRAIVLWSDLGATLVHETGPGADILGGALKRD